MLIETVVASSALFITALATAIALWECIRQHKGAAGPATYALEDIASEHFHSLILSLAYETRVKLTRSANDIRPDGQVLPATINEAPSDAAYTGRFHCSSSVHLFEHLYTVASLTIT